MSFPQPSQEVENSAVVNSAVAQQFKRELSAVQYLLCQMKEAHFKQTLRVLIDLHNDKINQSFKAEIQAMCNTQLSVGLHGMLGLYFADGQKPVQPTSSGKLNIPPDNTKSSFAAQVYIINDNEKEKLKNLFTGGRDENQNLACVSRRFTVSIKDICSEKPLMAMAWLTDDLSVDE